MPRRARTTKVACVLLLGVAVTGCWPLPRPPGIAYVAPPVATQPSTVPASATPPPTATSGSALDLPARPAPFGPLTRLKLGQTRGQVATFAPELAAHARADRGEVDFSVEFLADRVASMKVAFRDRDPMPELVARWGAPGEAGVWAVEGDGLQIIPDPATWSLQFVAYIPLVKLVAADHGKLAGLAADVLAMDRRAFEARFPDAKREERGRRTLFDVSLAPTEGTAHETALEADFDAGGALLALELSLSTIATAAADGALRAVYGAPIELPLCPPPRKPCEIVAGIYQADPVLRYGKGPLEVTTFPHDFARLTLRWSRTPTRTDLFTTFTPPERVREAEREP